MDSYRGFHPDAHLRTPKVSILDPKSMKLHRKSAPPDLPEAPGVPPGLHAALGMDLGWFWDGHMRSSMLNNS